LEKREFNRGVRREKKLTTESAEHNFELRIANTCSFVSFVHLVMSSRFKRLERFERLEHGERNGASAVITGKSEERYSISGWRSEG
jgi:hypothetical protein